MDLVDFVRHKVDKDLEPWNALDIRPEPAYPRNEGIEMQNATQQKTYEIKNLEDSLYKTYTDPNYRDLAREHSGVLTGLSVSFLLGTLAFVYLITQQSLGAILIAFALFSLVATVFANVEKGMRNLQIKRGNEVEYWANRWFDMNVKEEVFKASGYLITNRPLCHNQFEALSPEGTKATITLMGLNEEFAGMYVPGIGGYKIDERGVIMTVIR